MYLQRRKIAPDLPVPDYILFISTRNQLSSVVSEGTELGATVANFPLSSPFFPQYRNMRTSSKIHLFRWKACSKNNSLREWVDSKGTAHMEAPSNRLLPLHRPHIDPTSTNTQLLFQPRFISSKAIFPHHHISIVFSPSPPSALHSFCFSIRQVI